MQKTSAVKWFAFLVVCIAFLAGQNASAEFLCDQSVTGKIVAVDSENSTIEVADSETGSTLEFVGIPVSFFEEWENLELLDAEVTVFYHQCPSYDSVLKACSITLDGTTYEFPVRPGQSYRIPPAAALSSKGLGQGKGKGKGPVQ